MSENKQKHIVVLSGAGVSAESGIQTFRDGDGLWEKHNVQDVATPEAWQRDPELVLRFYNERREQIRKAEPNAAHKAIAHLEDGFKVTVITQNIDDLHERGGSTEVLHLHGEIFKARSTLDDRLIHNLGQSDIHPGDMCDKGSQLRPHIVWFGEDVPMYPIAHEVTQMADLVIVVGTSLQVQPASFLASAAPSHVARIVVDPKASADTPAFYLREPAGSAMPVLVDYLLANGIDDLSGIPGLQHA
ncbi:SIR2 family NAD-dependent protein deacylase [Oceanospirillum maris]|uniref:SIR2 family NAD-dependent protein deacylase n=1 Tax=Oceanospirillum maris TaxID=64977 RepID=UPI0003F56AB9|nr:NAD-dependent deacylase [Oceanospirillum maris]